MGKNIEVKEFVTETIKEIKEGLPEGFSIAENIDFELSVTKTDEAKGKFGIAVASAGGNTKTHNLQKIKFSICDDNAQLKKMKQAKDIFHEFFQGLAILDAEVTEPKKLTENKSKKNTNKKKKQ